MEFLVLGRDRPGCGSEITGLEEAELDETH